MAKSSRRSASKRPSGGKKKSARKRAPRTRAKKAVPEKIELRRLREFAEQHIALVDQHPAPTSQALQVRERMQQLVNEIRGFCGPNMTVPL